MSLTNDWQAAKETKEPKGELVFVPQYDGDKPDLDSASMRGYVWTEVKAPAPAPQG